MKSYRVCLYTEIGGGDHYRGPVQAWQVWANLQGREFLPIVIIVALFGTKGLPFFYYKLGIC